MHELNELLRKLGTALALTGFGLPLGVALLAGVDPMWAMLRAGVTSAALLALFWTLCRTVVPLLGADAVDAETTEAAGAA